MATSESLQRQRASHTKIVATVGPSCADEHCLEKLLLAGVDVFRVNAAHGDRAEHQQRLDQIRSVGRRLGRPVAVLFDLAGPKIRLGKLPGGQFRCSPGAQLRFVRGQTAKSPGDLTSTYESLVDELAIGDRVMLADGTVGLLVEERGEGYATCRVIQPGLIRSGQGINLPGAKLSIPTLGLADREEAVWAADNEVDFVGLSFVRTADDVRQLKTLLASDSRDDQPGGPQVIAKIEKPEAMDHLDAIVEAADGVMVARGDLGVETDIARMAVAQKEIIATCNRFRKPVIIATQMLDSMQHSRLPTRAEATDVANAILDGADACMLSGETAIGQYPDEAVRMMHRIALATEPLCRRARTRPKVDLSAEGVNPITEATVYAAGQLAEELDAKMVAVASASGATALSLSKNRNFVPTVGTSDSEATLRRMCLYWGVIPVPGAPTHDSSQLLQHLTNFGRKQGSLESGDRVVLITGTGLHVSAHNMIVVHELE